MNAKGYTKLAEECGELVQMAAKKIAYPDGPHPAIPDIQDFNYRVEQEIGDVLGAIDFVVQKNGLNKTSIELQAQRKFRIFKEWDNDPNN